MVKRLRGYMTCCAPIMSDLLPIAVLFWMSVSVGNAALLYEQLPLNNGFSVLSSVTDGQYRAENFFLTEDATISSISWWGSYLENDLPPNAAFTGYLYDSVAGAPGTLVKELAASGSGLDTPLDSGLVTSSERRTIYQFDVTLMNPFTLLAGEYFVAVMNDPMVPGAEDDFDWLWSESTQGDGSHWLSFNGSSWAPVPAGSASGVPAGNLAFRLNHSPPNGSLPNVSTLILLITGLGMAYGTTMVRARTGYGLPIAVMSAIKLTM